MARSHNTYDVKSNRTKTISRRRNAKAVGDETTAKTVGDGVRPVADIDGY